MKVIDRQKERSVKVGHLEGPSTRYLTSHMFLIACLFNCSCSHYIIVLIQEQKKNSGNRMEIARSRFQGLFPDADIDSVLSLIRYPEPTGGLCPSQCVSLRLLQLN